VHSLVEKLSAEGLNIKMIISWKKKKNKTASFNFFFGNHWLRHVMQQINRTKCLVSFSSKEKKLHFNITLFHYVIILVFLSFDLQI